MPIETRYVNFFWRRNGFFDLNRVGTVMGLIVAMANAGKDPNLLIRHIATAFIATLWGIFMANLVWLPLADIEPKAKTLLLSLTNILARFPNRLRIDGHTDNLPINNAKFASNWQLSTARAANVAHLLHEKGGIDGKRISVTGHASFDPALPNTTAKNRTINRRVEIVVLDE